MTDQYLDDSDPIDHSIPSFLRESLLRDITYDEPVYGLTPLEVNSDFLIEPFSDILLPVWCRLVGVSYKVNAHPDPEFRAKSTIIFWLSPEKAIDIYDLYNDEEL